MTSRTPTTPSSLGSVVNPSSTMPVIGSMMSHRSINIYLELIWKPLDRPLMLVLADSLLDDGDEYLSLAYREAAEKGWWPFVRRTLRLTDSFRPVLDADNFQVHVYDWERLDKPNEYRQVVPSHCKLPMELFNTMYRMLGDRVYGDEHAAFVLLARALEVYHIQGDGIKDRLYFDQPVIGTQERWEV